jgi:hypothetical protein
MWQRRRLLRDSVRLRTRAVNRPQRHLDVLIPADPPDPAPHAHERPRRTNAAHTILRPIEVARRLRGCADREQDIVNDPEIDTEHTLEEPSWVVSGPHGDALAAEHVTVIESVVDPVHRDPIVDASSCNSQKPGGSPRYAGISP